MEVAWSEFKKFIDQKRVSPQMVIVGSNYWLKAMNEFFDIECLVSTDPAHPDTQDFEANYLPICNQSTTPEVVTQFEKRDKTLKIAHAEAPVDPVTGEAVALLRVPGTPGTDDGRWISAGVAFFDQYTPGDKIISVHFTDEDNLLGMGAGAVAGSYTDDAADAGNQGWAIPPCGFVKAEAVGGYGFAPAGLYLRVTGKKGGAAPYSGTLFVNLEWSEQDDA